MPTFNPALDQPTTVDYADIPPDVRFHHSNTEVHYTSGRDSDLYGLYWGWHDRSYAQSIRVRMSAPMYTSQGISADASDDLMPLVTRFFPGYQETIYGSEGVIVSKRTFAPLESNYDRAALWLLECQAEGHRLVRIEVEIEWGQPLEQRMVDGLLVAQRAPREAQGLHGQRNAESTRVFGAAEGRPDYFNLFDGSRAYLLYHVLVVGQVDLPLILTLSDVGEQVAWNGFLAQRDISRAFKLSQDGWRRITHQGRLWTPDPAINWGVQQAKIDAFQRLTRLRTGLAPTDGRMTSVPALVDALDACSVDRSRDLLDTLRRLAQKTDGRLPQTFPLFHQETPPDPGASLPETVHAYLSALLRHLQRHPDAAVLMQHRPAVQACGEALIRFIHRGRQPGDRSGLLRAAESLDAARRLAQVMQDSADEARWESEAAALGLPSVAPEGGSCSVAAWSESLHASPPVPGAEPGLDLVQEGLMADVLWRGVGLAWQEGQIRVAPGFPDEWAWWGLFDLPLGDGLLSLVWDGEMLHANRPVASAAPVQIHEFVRAVGSDEDRFNLRFVLGHEQVFRPVIEEGPGRSRGS